MHRQIIAGRRDSHLVFGISLVDANIARDSGRPKVQAIAVESLFKPRHKTPFVTHYHTLGKK